MAERAYGPNKTAKNVVSFELFKLMHVTYGHCINHLSDIRNYEFPDTMLPIDRIQAKGGCLARFYSQITEIRHILNDMLPNYFNIEQDDNFNYVPYDVMRVALDGISYRIAEALMEACHRRYVGRQDRLQLRLFHLRNILDTSFTTYLHALRAANMLGSTNLHNVNQFIHNHTRFLSEADKCIAFNGPSD